MKASIIIPVYNEQGNIGPLIERLYALYGAEHELIVVDDCSTDGTISEVDTSKCQLLKHEVNQGKGAAMKTGIAVASGDIIGFIDGDAQDDPAEIIKLIKEVENGADLAIGSRFKDISESGDGKKEQERFSNEAVLPVNEMGNKILTQLVNKMFNAKFSDVCASLRFYNAEKLKQIDIDSKRYEVETEMAIRAIRMNLKIVEVPVHRYPRQHGKSNLYQVPFGRFKFALRVFKVFIKAFILWR